MLRTVFHVIGLLLAILSLAMLVPAAVDYHANNPDWKVFIASAGTTLYIGGVMYLGSHGRPVQINNRTGYVITASSWVVVSLFGALPLAYSSLNIPFVDAVFETVSGLTTTGSTVLVGLDSMAPGLLLWRSLMNWIGGVGIVVMAIFMLPLLRVGGMQLFRSESSDVSDKIAPRAYEIAATTIIIYVVLTIISAVAFRLAGMGTFDSINHAMASLATGGFSTKDASVGYYNSLPIELVAIVSMVAGALPLIFYARIFKEGRRAFLTEGQVPVFLAILAAAIGLMTAWRHLTSDVGLWRSLRDAAFNVTSILTDTGFATTDFSAWGTGAQGMFLLLMFIGGCAGSTSGAIKIFRWQLLVQSFKGQIRRALSPSRVVLVRYQGRPVDDGMIASVRNFFFMYIMTWAFFSTALMMSGLDMMSAMSSVAQAMANAGPGLGPLVGPATNFASIPEESKWLLSLAMVLGRLELTTIYVLFFPDFWKR